MTAGPRVAVAAVAMLLMATLPAVAGDAPGSLDGLAWLAGCWQGSADGFVIEEHWMAPAAGVMLGLHRDVSPDGGVSFEYLRIVAGDDGVDYIASPSGRRETRFRLVEHGEQRAVFANPEHDFPTRIIYWLDRSALHARIEGNGDGAGSREWVWRRTTCP